jgi:hypothetical protein
MAHAREECRVGVEQAVEAIDQNARRQQVEQRAVAHAVAARRRRRLGQPFGRRVRRIRRLDWRFGCGLRRRLGRAGGDRLPLAFEALGQLPGELVERAVLDRRQRRRSGIAGRAERHDVGGRFHWRFRIGWV